MTRFSFTALSCFLAVSSLHGLQTSAQTNERLLEERLISPAVYELLKSRNANTRYERLEAVQQACTAGQLPPSDCANTKRRREY